MRMNALIRARYPQPYACRRATAGGASLPDARVSRCLPCGFPKTTLQPSGTVTLRTGTGTNSPGVRYWNKTWYVWNNNGDTAGLRNAAGTFIHSCWYGEPANISKTCA